VGWGEGLTEKEFVVKVLAVIFVEYTVSAENEEEARREAETQFNESLEVIGIDNATLDVGTEIVGAHKERFLRN